MLRFVSQNFRILAWTVMILWLGPAGCAHFDSANYRAGVGEFDGPEDYTPSRELYSSNKVLQSAEQQPAAEFTLLSPVKNLVVNRGFGKTNRHDHLGVDLKGRKNDKIFAAHHGTVIYAGSGFRGYGRMVIVEYNKHWATLYAHLNRLKVKTGTKVKAGSLIGLMGRTGRATGVHLHFELMYDKIPIDPLPVLQNGAPMNFVN